MKRSLALILLFSLCLTFSISSDASALAGGNSGTYTTTAANGDTMTVVFHNQGDLGQVSPVAPISPALSSNYFTWTATIACCITSRQWTSTSAGAVTIRSYVPCDAGAGSIYTIALYRFNTQQSPGPVNYSCGQTLQYTWNAQPPGDFSFRLQKRTDGIVQIFTGTVFYP